MITQYLLIIPNPNRYNFTNIHSSRSNYPKKSLHNFYSKIFSCPRGKNIRKMSVPRLLLLVASLLIIYNECTSALRILAIYPFPGKSHSIGAEHLLEEMTRRGHTIDVVSHFPRKNPIPNYRDISLRGLLPMFANNVTYDRIKGYNFIHPREFVQLAGVSVCELLGEPVLQELMETPKGTYDVILVHLFAAHCYIGFGNKLNAPVVGMVTSKFQDWLFEPFANPLNPSYMPSFFSTFTQHMTFWERLENTLITDNTRLQFRYWLETESLQVEKYFGRKISSLHELYDDVSLILVNQHFSTNEIKPSTPDIIDIGGLHVYNNTQQLTPELQDWLDRSTEGCVSFTLGSNVVIESFPEELLKVFYQSFESIAPVRVLMKGDPRAHLKDLPTNVMIFPWIPQVAVLKHKNVRAFITHGGLLGTQEAIAHRVPMIGIPLFGDQHTNMRNYEKRGIAVVLDLKTLNKDSLTAAITTVLEDPTYRENIGRISDLFWDRPMSPLDTAIYWMEYAARRGPVLKSPATQLSWWKLHLLDVYSFILICILTTVYTITRVVTLLWKWASGINSKNVSNAKKNK
ncbi:UDP-glucosyltransferase 2-like [Diachasmimorpha longicaudata]|uniref:UDP-glucosyltransferase 2-like n=1 Tax=Diachasmimorpha longicaudata TaxID=58733 RepID=UPI0030B87204